MSTDDKVRTAAQNAIKVWSTTYNALVSRHEFECHELDQAMMDLSTALAAALEPPKGPEGAVSKPPSTVEPHCDKCGKSIVGTIVCRGYHFLCLDCSETPGAWNVLSRGAR